jgi:hypothetical protein
METALEKKYGKNDLTSLIICPGCADAVPAQSVVHQSPSKKSPIYRRHFMGVITGLLLRPIQVNYNMNAGKLLGFIPWRLWQCS